MVAPEAFVQICCFPLGTKEPYAVDAFTLNEQMRRFRYYSLDMYVASCCCKQSNGRAVAVTKQKCIRDCRQFYRRRTTSGRLYRDKFLGLFSSFYPFKVFVYDVVQV